MLCVVYSQSAELMTSWQSPNWVHCCCACFSETVLHEDTLLSGNLGRFRFLCSCVCFVQPFCFVSEYRCTQSSFLVITQGVEEGVPMHRWKMCSFVPVEVDNVQFGAFNSDFFVNLRNCHVCLKRCISHPVEVQFVLPSGHVTSCNSSFNHLHLSINGWWP